MRLFHLTVTTIFRRKSWAICLLCVAVFPFLLPLLSTATENQLLVQPARAQAAWNLAWIVALIWGFFSAAMQGEANARSGVGEYFETTGIGRLKQLAQIWAAHLAYLIPAAILAALVCILGASPRAADERSMWLVTNLQYVLLFILVIAPLLALAIGLSARFGAIAGFAVTLGLALYGLYGVGYMEMLLRLEGNKFLQTLWIASPHYHLADLTPRLLFKSGALLWKDFANLILYFTGFAMVWLACATALFRTKSSH